MIEFIFESINEQDRKLNNLVRACKTNDRRLTLYGVSALLMSYLLFTMHKQIMVNDLQIAKLNYKLSNLVCKEKDNAGD